VGSTCRRGHDLEKVGRTPKRRGVKWTHCTKGHSYAEVGRRANGACAECDRAAHRRRYRANLNQERRKSAEYRTRMPMLQAHLPRADYEALVAIVGWRGLARAVRKLVQEFVRLNSREAAHGGNVLLIPAKQRKTA
jgi:hypothetical protein